MSTSPGDRTPNLATQSGDVWTSPAWRSLALAWIDEQLAAAGIDRTGPVEDARVRSWSTVFSVPTTAGRAWFKAAGPTTAFEVPLYQLLRRHVPQHVLTPIAADVARRWLLLPDGGQPLADALSRPELLDALLAVFSRYGQMQRDISPYASDLLTLGLPDMRPTIMPRRFDDAVHEAGRYVDRFGTQADQAVLADVVGLRDTFAAWCERLASSQVGPTLDHGDLHPKNILVTGTEIGGPARPFDWGTSVVAHPFTSILIPLRFVVRMLRVSYDDPAVERARDAYLDSFRDLAPHSELVTTLEAACRTGMVVRSLLAVSLARESGGQGRGKRETAFAWLTYLLDDAYLGRVDRAGRAPAARLTRRSSPR